VRVTTLAVVIPVVTALFAVGEVRADTYRRIAEFQFGHGDHELALIVGDGMTTAPGIKVGTDGRFVIIDRANDRVLLLDRAGAVKATLEPPPQLGVVLTAIPLSNGQVLVSWAGRGAATTRYDWDGNVTLSRAWIGDYVGTERNGHLVFTLGRGANVKYAEYDNDLNQLSVSNGRPAGLGSGEDYRGMTGVTNGSDCYLLSGDFSGDIKFFPGYLLVAGMLLGRADKTTGNVQLWQLPPRQVEPPLPAYPGAPWPDRVIWLIEDLTIGDDGNFYSLIRTLDHFELVQWDLSGLPTKPYTKPALPPLRLKAIPDQTARAGKGFILMTGREVGSWGKATFTVTGLPAGATWTPGGSQGLIISWNPPGPAAGTYRVTVRVKNGLCQSDEKQFTLTVTP
jgi:hypothetical protein